MSISDLLIKSTSSEYSISLNFKLKVLLKTLEVKVATPWMDFRICLYQCSLKMMYS